MITNRLEENLYSSTVQVLHLSTQTFEDRGETNLAWRSQIRTENSPCIFLISVVSSLRQVNRVLSVLVLNGWAKNFSPRTMTYLPNQGIIRLVFCQPADTKPTLCCWVNISCELHPMSFSHYPVRG